MKIKKDTNDILQISSFPIGITLFGWTISLVILGTLIRDLLNGISNTEKLTGGSVGVLIGFFGGSAFCKKEVFTVDKKLQTIFWSKKSVFGQTKGEIPFDQISNVIIQRHRHSQASYSYRLAVAVKDEIIPISQMYSVGSEKKCKKIQKKIMKMIT